MSDVIVVQQRPDVDIQNDIQALIVTYPPTAADRHQITVSVVNGQVELRGHVSTPINRRYLLNQIPGINGVKAVDSSQLYDDETIRLEVGRRLPEGIFANVRVGTVVLSGKLPAADGLDGIARAVATVPGVLRVVAQA